MKLGIIGAGKIVKEVLTFIKDIEEIDLVAIAATKKSETKLKEMSRTYDIDKYYLDYKELIRDPEVEVVYVALINSLHYEVMAYAIEYGKDIICEKPFASSYRESKEIFDKAFSKNLLVIEAVSHRFIPNALAVRKEIKNIGDIKLVSFNYSQYSSRYDDFKEGIIAPVFSRKQAGGSLMDINFYNVDYLAGLFGRPKDVKYFPNIEREIDTSGILYLDYGDFKAIAIGSKDTDVASVNTIQADGGSIEIRDSLSTFSSFRIKKRLDKDYRQVNLNEPCNRLFYEFKEIAKLIACRDMKRVKEYSINSLDTAWILEEARKYAGIIFPSDL